MSEELIKISDQSQDFPLFDAFFHSGPQYQSQQQVQNEGDAEV